MSSLHSIGGEGGAVSAFAEIGPPRKRRRDGFATRARAREQTGVGEEARG